MHRLNEEDRSKVYETIKELYCQKDKDVEYLEVKHEQDGIECVVYRVVTRYDNTYAIVDYSYDEDYQSSEDSKSRAVVKKWTLDIPKELMDKAIEVCGGEESILNSYAIIKLFRDNNIEGTEKLVKWFIRHLEIDGLLNKYDEIIGDTEPSDGKVDEAAITEAENSEYHGGSYDV